MAFIVLLMHLYIVFAMGKCCLIVDSECKSHNQHEWIDDHPVDEAVEEHTFDTETKESE